MNNYSKYFELMKDYPFDSSHMSHDYEKLFAEIQNKDDIKLNLFKFYLFNVIRYLNILLNLIRLVGSRL